MTSDILLLTIGIPTYNRFDSLCMVLEKLTECKYEIGECELLIINNAGEFDINIVKEILSKSDLELRVIQNANNCGGQENVMRIYENSIAKYVWFLGDDDFIRPDIMSKLLFQLRSKNLDLFFINNHGGKKWTDNTIVKFIGFDEYLSGIYPLRVLSFAPNNIIKKEILTNFLPISRLHLQCFLPQFCLILLSNPEKIVSVDAHIIDMNAVDNQRSERLSLYPIFIGISNIVYVPHAEKIRNKIRSLLRSEQYHYLSLDKIARTLVIYRINNKSIDYGRLILSGYSIYGFFNYLAFLILLALISTTPKLLLRKIVLFIIKRYGFDKTFIENYYSESRV